MENVAPVKKPASSIFNMRTITLAIALLLFVIGLVMYVSSSELMNPRTPALMEPIGERPSRSLAPSARPSRVEGQVIVKFKVEATEAQITNRLRPLNASIKTKLDDQNTIVISVPPGQEDAVLRELSTDPLVLYAEPDYIYYLQFTPNDPNLLNQWFLINNGQTVNGRTGIADADIDAEQAWDVSRGTGIIVAVLDSGIDSAHPEFASKIVTTRAFVAGDAGDRNGHGTHVAGIVAAGTNNGRGVAGVCPECRLLIGKVANDDGSVPSSATAPGIRWAADNGAKVINLSLAGNDMSQTIQDSINYAWSKNIVIVSAAGNEGVSTKRFPAAFANVIAVANTDNTDKKTANSNFGTWVHMAAPGHTIYSTFPTTASRVSSTNFGFLNGTSMASPVVSGVAALVWKTQYGTNNAAVVQRLFDTADKIEGTGTQWAVGRVNAGKAVGVAAAPTTTQPGPSTLIPSFVCGGSTTSICPTNPSNPIVQPTEYAIVSPEPNPNYYDPGTAIPGIGDGDSGNGHHKKSVGFIGVFINLLLTLIMLLLRIVFGAFGGI